MRIGILTFQRSISYGAVLQCWALSQVLSKLGHDVKVVDYQPPYRKKLQNPAEWSRFYSRKNLFEFRLFLKFHRFIQKNLPLTEKKFRSIDDLRSSPCPYDALVCGSDQIWNVARTGPGADPAYFCNFGPKSVVRISYAPSLGGPGIADPFLDGFKEQLGALDHVSVREASARAFIETFCNRRCEHVLDPTLLGLDFSPMEAPLPLPPKYVFSYSLQKNPSYDQVLSQVREQFKLPIIQVERRYKMPHNADWTVVPSPGQWLTLLRNAAFIVTNSFHGTCFALNYRKPFLTLGLVSSLGAVNERLTGLLDSLGLSERFLQSGLRDCGPILDRSIDWGEFDKSLSRQRDSSVRFLVSSLSTSRDSRRSNQAHRPVQKT